MPHPTATLVDELENGRTSIAVIGLGYVGLPLALAFAERFAVVGFDSDEHRISRLEAGCDDHREVTPARLAAARRLRFAHGTEDLDRCRLVIIAVPTPVDEAHQPDFRPLLSACRSVGERLRPGMTVVFESTVYPGATEEICLPALLRASGLVPGRDMAYGYSPERINSGDRTHGIESVVKVVSGSDPETCARLAAIYGAIIPAGVYQAQSIAVAEAAKVIENTQRDINIALVNELSVILHRLGIDTLDVLKAAGTKWNFLPFRPGLVGGHCIGVDPYYLTYKAESMGYHPELILAGRRINDGMGAWIAQECIRLLIQAGGKVASARVLILGLAFKPDVTDVRNSRVVDIVRELVRFGAEAVVVDPIADPVLSRQEHGIELQPRTPLPRCQAVIAAVAHAAFADIDVATLVAACGRGAPLLDLTGNFDRAQVAAAGLVLWRL